MKKILLIFAVVIIILGGAFAVFLGQFELFPTEEEFLTSFVDSDQNHYRVIYIPSNATTNDVVQIRRSLDQENKYELVKIMEGYTKFSLLEVTFDSLRFVVWDHLENPSQRDTVTIGLTVE